MSVQFHSLLVWVEIKRFREPEMHSYREHVSVKWLWGKRHAVAVHCRKSWKIHQTRQLQLISSRQKRIEEEYSRPSSWVLHLCLLFVRVIQGEQKEKDEVYSVSPSLYFWSHISKTEKFHSQYSSMIACQCASGSLFPSDLPSSLNLGWCLNYCGIIIYGDSFDSQYPQFSRVVAMVDLSWIPILANRNDQVLVGNSVAADITQFNWPQIDHFHFVIFTLGQSTDRHCL